MWRTTIYGAGFSLTLAFLLVTVACGSREENPADEEVIWSAALPQAKDDPYWEKKHSEDVDEAKKGNVDLLFVGDSIMERWETEGENVWKRYYAHRKPMNIGVIADQTQHVLWRLDHGAIDGLQPKVVVLMIGTNNAQDFMEFGIGGVREGIWAVVQSLQSKLPEAEILLLGLLPRNHKLTATRVYLRALNRDIEARAKGEDRVHYMEIWDEFLDSDTQRLWPWLMDNIALHPTEAGYQIWAEAMEPLLSRLLGDESVKPEENLTVLKRRTNGLGS